MLLEDGDWKCSHPENERASDPMGGKWCLLCGGVVEMPSREALDAIGWPRPPAKDTAVNGD